MVRATLSGDYVGVSKGRLLMMLAAAGYLVSPLDLIPEAVLPIIGLADDALVLARWPRKLVEETEAFLEWEKATMGFPAGCDRRRSRRRVAPAGSAAPTDPYTSAPPRPRGSQSPATWCAEPRHPQLLHPAS